MCEGMDQIQGQPKPKQKAPLMIVGDFKETTRVTEQLPQIKPLSFSFCLVLRIPWGQTQICMWSVEVVWSI